MFKSILLILISVLLGVVGQVNLKQGMTTVTTTIKEKQIPNKDQTNNQENNLSSTITKIFSLLITAAFNPRVIAGVMCYGFSMIFWLLILSRVDLSFAYPMLGMSYIMVVLSAWLILKEDISPIRWAGTLIISLGVILVARS